MQSKVTLTIILRTFFLFPFFMIFVLAPLLLLIIVASFLPNGKLIATKLYELFGWVGLKFVGIKLIVKGAEKIITVSEDEIIFAMKLIWERMKIICEPSCAVPLAAILKTKQVFKNKNVGIILTGGNVDLKNLPF